MTWRYWWQWLLHIIRQWYQSWVTVDNVVMIEDYFGDCVLTSVLCLNNCWWLPINFGVDWRLYLWLIVACDELFAAGFVSCWWQQQDTAKWPDHSLVGLAAVKCHQQHESAGSWHCLPWSGEWCFLVVLFTFDVILIHWSTMRKMVILLSILVCCLLWCVQCLSTLSCHIASACVCES